MQNGKGLGKLISSWVFLLFVAASLFVIFARDERLTAAYSEVAGFLITAMSIHMGVIGGSKYLQTKAEIQQLPPATVLAPTTQPTPKPPDNPYVVG
jgi:hypothetical protein